MIAELLRRLVVDAVHFVGGQFGHKPLGDFARLVAISQRLPQTLSMGQDCGDRLSDDHEFGGSIRPIDEGQQVILASDSVIHCLDSGSG